ncbi:hypothetical protein HY522_06265 [bacterium]|nr:hypothetical protein [bacterium]
MLILLVGQKGAGKSECAKYLVEKHRFEKIPVRGALSRNTRDGFFLVDGLPAHKDLAALLEKGAALWLVRRPGKSDQWKGRPVTIKIENRGTLAELRTAVEQKLWGCC